MDTGTLSQMQRLLILQDHDIRIRDIERELKDIPERKRIEDARLTQHRADVAKAEEGQKLRQSAIKQLELDVQTRKEQILKLRRQQTELKTNKEFQAIDSEIKTLEGSIRGVEDKELELMALLDEATRLLEASKRDLAQEATVVQRDMAVWDERAAVLQRDLDAARAERATAAATVTEKEWMSLYERVFSRKDRAIVTLDAGVCGGCHMQLPPYVVHDVKKHARLVTCEYCGRLLVDG